jgi:Na+/melibiose symporter-like transporter
MALGPGIFGAVLAVGSYRSLGADVPAEVAASMQPSSAAIAIILGFTLIPAFFVLVALPLLKQLARSQGAQQV